MFLRVPLRRSRCRRERQVQSKRFKNERKEYKASLSTDIYMSRRLSRLNCPANQPHIFESQIKFKYEMSLSVFPFIVPIRYHYRATNTQYCELLIYPLHYNVLSCQSWNFPHDSPLIQIRPRITTTG